ncbi:Predicted alpha-1,6-mannanase, GH76 family [Mucilaginibacter pineti]|uniref:Predicted alpha-1,6-mannanase, GH76 family n=2 Tax=Mucilaginibacter pineti TaxID=1391627 RepID=A0A1G7MK79_9SPHI|nr:Predicted alpha-1,6-mannanase, GH76 family [Mucilaginibacter pineti]
MLLLCAATVMQSCKKSDNNTGDPAAVVPEKIKPTAAISPRLNTTDKFAKTYTFKGLATNYKNIKWDFGDNTTATDITIEHKFVSYGIYKVTLTATDADGNAASDVTTINVADPSSWGINADKGQITLQSYFYDVNEQFYKTTQTDHGFNYWWNAHALDVNVDAYNRTKDAKYLTRMKNVLSGSFAKNGNKFKNDFYDDMEWWAIACLRAFDASNDMAYKNAALELWGYIKTGWNDNNHGGIMWNAGDSNGKNACSNGPAAIIAARLYQLDKKQEDLDWAVKIYAWEKQYLVNAANGLVWDSYGNYNDGWRFTYNQGTYVGAAVELYACTKDLKYLNDAKQTTSSVITDPFFNNGGVLIGNGTGDGGLFKGIFIRYMVQLIIKGNLDASTQSTYSTYLVNNANNLIANAINSPEGYYGPDWRKLPQTNEYQSSVQLSGLMLLEGVHELWLLDIVK